MRALALVMCAGLVLGCGGSDSPAGPDVSVGTIVIANESSLPIVDVRISPCIVDTWGDDRLRGSLAPGREASFKLAPACWDAKATADDSKALFAIFWRNFLIGGETVRLTVNDRNLGVDLSSAHGVP